LAQTTTQKKLLIVNVNDMPAKVTTDIGSQTSLFEGQLAFMQTRNSAGQIAVALRSFNLIGRPVQTRFGSSGPISVRLEKGSAITRSFDPSSGSIVVDLALILHYQLIDQIKGYKRTSSDSFASFTETLQGRFTGEFARPLSWQTTTNNSISGATGFRPSRIELGGIRGLDLIFQDSVLRELLTSLAGCDAVGVRTLCIQPVFIRSGENDPEPTGRALDTFMERARWIWGKTCISFDVRDPIYVEDADFKVVTAGDDRASPEETDLMDTVDDPDCIEVYFIASFDPASSWGGGVTFASGTARAKIITADNNIDQDPPSLNHLAHELGHVLGLCHPNDDDCAAPMILGTAGTVMEGSGFFADNPHLQSADNGENADNPLLYVREIRCCPRPEIK
jgi:hypothetical protein